MRILLLVFAITLGSSIYAADYAIDIKGQHAFINFKVKHLGYSWLIGSFNKFDGTFSYDADNHSDTKITVNIDTSSVYSNNPIRDKHLRSADFLNVAKYSMAKFSSNKYQERADGTGVLTGMLTFNGVSKEIIINTEKIGEGNDPWGGYRVGFSGVSVFKMADFNIAKSLGPLAMLVYLEFNIEGVRIKN